MPCARRKPPICAGFLLQQVKPACATSTKIATQLPPWAPAFTTQQAHPKKASDLNHRAVRRHAARMLSFLGDSRAREAALHLKDAMRAAEAPYLRRILAATGETRVCDVDEDRDTTSTLGACVYNATSAPQEGLRSEPPCGATSRGEDVEFPRRLTRA